MEFTVEDKNMKLWKTLVTTIDDLIGTAMFVVRRNELFFRMLDRIGTSMLEINISGYFFEKFKGTVNEEFIFAVRSEDLKNVMSKVPKGADVTFYDDENKLKIIIDSDFTTTFTLPFVENQLFYITIIFSG